MSVTMLDTETEFETYKKIMRAHGCSIGKYEYNDSILIPIQRKKIFGGFKSASLLVAYLVMSPGRVVFNGLDRRGESVIREIADELSTTYGTNVVISW